MKKPNDIPEILEARNLLEDGEKSSILEIKIRKFEEGLNILNSYLKENPDTSNETKTLIDNIKLSYTRRLLNQLKEIGDNIEKDIHSKYFNMIWEQMRGKTIKRIFEEYPDLRDSFIRFIQIHDPILGELFKDFLTKEHL